MLSVNVDMSGRLVCLVSLVFSDSTACQSVPTPDRRRGINHAESKQATYADSDKDKGKDKDKGGNEGKHKNKAERH